ncbi:hypothetical protein HR45_12950 [Shewanella mangrovi]|uniref:Uncharacterized protein n=1 Tax=Shewanella mangrovi TaxID=1515746 RepID=A0A094JCJ9_9GAMM|nr:hypothetical protein HR45_12950 [Shewanella mangrovi]
MLSLGLVNLSFASDTELKLIAPEFTGLITEAGDGPYQKIMQQVALRAGIKYQERVYPQKRAYMSFLKQQDSCIYSFTEPASERLGQQQIIVSAPLNTFSMYLFTAKDSAPIQQLTQVAPTANVLGVLGYDVWYQRAGLPQAGIQLAYTSSDEHAVGMVNLGRADMMVSFMPDMRKFADQVSYDAAYPLLISYDGITCHNTEANAALLKVISPVLGQMRRDGTLAQLLGESYLPWQHQAFKKWQQQYTAEMPESSELDSD